MEIKVLDIIKSELAIFHNEGLQVHQVISESIKKNQPVKINFTGIERCSTQFLNAAIGKLYMEFKPATVDNNLQYDFSTSKGLESKVNEVRLNAINYKAYDNLVATAIA